MLYNVLRDKLISHSNTDNFTSLREHYMYNNEQMIRTFYGIYHKIILSNRKRAKTYSAILLYRRT